MGGKESKRMAITTVLKIGDKVRNKTLKCEAVITDIQKKSFGMIHIEVETPYGKIWCYPHDLEESR